MDRAHIWIDCQPGTRKTNLLDGLGQLMPSHRLIILLMFVNPFPHMTILQQTTLNIFCQIMENLFNWMDNLWLKVENIVAKGEIAKRAISFFVTMFSKSHLLQRHQKASIWGKGLKAASCYPLDNGHNIIKTMQVFNLFIIVSNFKLS